MNRTKQKAALYLLGLFAYLILSITCYQQAWAEDELEPTSIGYWYDAFQGDSRHDRANAIFQVTNALVAASYGMAQGDPSNEFADAAYLNERATMIRSCVPAGITNEGMAEMFFDWAVLIEMRENVWLGAAAALFLDVCYRSANKPVKS